MLNISENKISNPKQFYFFKSFYLTEGKRSEKVTIRLIQTCLALAFIALILPWTQNIQSQGFVTSLKPEQRPQTIQSRISGRLEKWFVQEGDYVGKGDTIVQISEIKSQYLDPNMVQRFQSQLASKQQAVKSYRKKIEALDKQIEALERTAKLKNAQIVNKKQQIVLSIQSDSIDFEAAKIEYNIAKSQYERIVKLHENGLKSLTDVEKRNNTLQKAQAKMVSKENKLLTSQNKLMNIEVEIVSVQAQYNEKIAKANSNQFSAHSALFDAEAMVAKLQNQLANYMIRSGMYFITAPQNGYVTRAIRSGLGETIKEGEDIVSIMPAKYDLAIETYIRPIDLPLLQKSQVVRIQFDGWPAIVFSGWPNTSYGTYGGTVYAIDNFISPNGMYRVLVAQDPNDHPWPDALRVGAGSKTMILLKDVPIWYELWRKINGFPPDYYKSQMSNSGNEKSKK